MVTDVLAWSLFLAFVIVRFGTGALAANNYMFRFLMVSFMPCFGLSAAVTALVGRYVGAGRNDIAAQRAHLGFKVASLYMFGCGLLYFFAREPLIHLFTRDPEVLRIGTTLLVFAAIYQLFDSMFIIYNGALRGAGDTLIPAWVTGLAVWTIMLGGGYVMARYFPRFGVAGPWTLASIYGAFLGVFMLTRFRLIIPKAVAAEQTADAVSPDEKPSATLHQLEPTRCPPRRSQKKKIRKAIRTRSISRRLLLRWRPSSCKTSPRAWPSGRVWICIKRSCASAPAAHSGSFTTARPSPTATFTSAT